MGPEDLTEEQREWLRQKFGGSVRRSAATEVESEQPKPDTVASDVGVAAVSATEETTTPATTQATTPESEPEPNLYVRGRRVTENDVRAALRMLGDDALAAYGRGEMTKAEAFSIAQRRIRELGELGGFGRSQRWSSDGDLSARAWSRRFRRGG